MGNAAGVEHVPAQRMQPWGGWEKGLPSAGHGERVTKGKMLSRCCQDAHTSLFRSSPCMPPAPPCSTLHSPHATPLSHYLCPDQVWLPDVAVKTRPPLPSPRLLSAPPPGSLLTGPSAVPPVQLVSRKLYRFLR